jgi:serine/threonine protein kinase
MLRLKINCGMLERPLLRASMLLGDAEAREPPGSPLIQIVKKMLNPDPSQRPTANELLREPYYAGPYPNYQAQHPSMADLLAIPSPWRLGCESTPDSE